ncbi:MAG: 30S ribosomal protein S9 [Candidatus Omnitrophica bacterium]|nr:30S ribosomal protein S9 [Candidatus Omnitrophota bacterium]
METVTEEQPQNTLTEKTSILATGRRKESVAQVHLLPGEGKIEVNGKPLKDYFRQPTHQVVVQQPLEATHLQDKFHIVVKVKGGGLSGQAGAVHHAIARALVKADASLRQVLRRGGYLTRDPRMKERKKYGQKGARKRFQWTKR